MESMTLELRTESGKPRVVITKGIPSHQEVEHLLHWLGDLRRTMGPEVPTSLPEGFAVAIDQVLMTGAEVNRLVDGTPTLCLRHPAYGWTAYRIRPSTLSWLIEALEMERSHQQQLDRLAQERKTPPSGA